MTRFSMQPKTRKYVKGYRFLPLSRIYMTNMEKIIAYVFENKTRY